jgi:hypothetical protein
MHWSDVIKNLWQILKILDLSKKINLREDKRLVYFCVASFMYCIFVDGTHIYMQITFPKSHQRRTFDIGNPRETIKCSGAEFLQNLRLTVDEFWRRGQINIWAGAQIPQISDETHTLLQLRVAGGCGKCSSEATCSCFCLMNKSQKR